MDLSERSVFTSQELAWILEKGYLSSHPLANGHPKYMRAISSFVNTGKLKFLKFEDHQEYIKELKIIWGHYDLYLDGDELVRLNQNDAPVVLLAWIDIYIFLGSRTEFEKPIPFFPGGVHPHTREQRKDFSTLVYESDLRDKIRELEVELLDVKNENKKLNLELSKRYPQARHLPKGHIGYSAEVEAVNKYSVELFGTAKSKEDILGISIEYELDRIERRDGPLKARDAIKRVITPAVIKRKIKKI